jgi:hypothetical protein
MHERLVLRIRGHRFEDLRREINRLRSRDGEKEEVGPLALAAKLEAHFNDVHNLRVAEAFRNLEERAKKPQGETPTL